MSTLWTPDGERPIRRQPDATPAASPPSPADSSAQTAEAQPGDAEMHAHLEALREQLASAPAEAVIANHAYGLFELAAVHLSQRPAHLDQARLAIDALGSLVEGLAGRLGDGEAQLSDGLAQLRLAYVQIQRSAEPASG